MLESMTHAHSFRIFPSIWNTSSLNVDLEDLYGDDTLTSALPDHVMLQQVAKMEYPPRLLG